MTLDDTLMAYSMSKTVTAVAVLQLVQSGRMTLADPIANLLAEAPYPASVTVGLLLAHLGGVPNPLPLRWVHPAASSDSFDERAALRAVLEAHPRLASPAGARYRYSNFGYWLLGAAVEQVSGRAFAGYVRQHILDPLAIAPSALGYAVEDPSRHAEGYLEKYSFFNLLKRWPIDSALVGEYSGNWLRIAAHYPNGPAFGGLVGTARSFATFNATGFDVRAAQGALDAGYLS